MATKDIFGRFLPDAQALSEDLVELGSGKYWHRKPVEDEDNPEPYPEDDS
jgi:hypothetical protein